MTDLREQRNKAIVKMYFELRQNKKTNPLFTKNYCINQILNSEQNKAWCLGETTLKKIISDKNYGNHKRGKN